jgi:hypothetical protein
MSTIAPTDYRATWPAPVGRDTPYAAGYRAGLADGRQHRDRLVAVAVVGGIVLGGRRFRVHWILLAVVVVLLLPVLVVVLVAEMAIRHHREHHHWPRTAAYAASWLVGLGLLLLAAVHQSVWPLVGMAALVVAWTAGPRVLAFERRDGDRGPKGPGPGGLGDTRCHHARSGASVPYSEGSWRRADPMSTRHRATAPH